ncbi:extracellular metalloproteinase [Aspergillus homomorphus CBS 101889]|uniref:Extracellular metalloproteinase n=1 Tax=Aspergillus homomorphus (strain CBS 101889) TaxID=1450537 RepID=A0A395HMJ8_ASPHC|nr:extracellular metallo proteinase MEP [Aspergillus homomorphus CBS 101889]RAL08846.1 extracellular metallo proteinase MEP [Aspergillus homomorphus CBS 101889]
MLSLLCLLILGFAVSSAALTRSSLRTGGVIHDLTRFRLRSRAYYVHSVDAMTGKTGLFIRARHESYLATAAKLVQTVVPGADFCIVADHYIGDNGVVHVNLRQTVHKIDVDNADFNVNIGQDGKVISYGNSFYVGDVPEARPLIEKNFLGLSISLENASLESTKEQNSYVFKGTSRAMTNPRAILVYFVKPDESLALSWRIETNLDENWFLTYVDAGGNAIIHGIVDYAAAAADYKVYEWGLNDPTEGSRTIVTDPWDTTVSPFTWIGNNGIAQSNPTGFQTYLDNYRLNSLGCKFVYPYSPTMSPPDSYVNASIVQLFYTANTYHDLLYDFGFTEKAGNFQWSNNGATNNGYFKTPPDGQPGYMRITLFTHSTPYRDSAFDAGMVIHEYTHGLSNRLTGGPANSGCLSSFEASGMGEGWSDFMATAVRLKANDSRATDYPICAWVANAPGRSARAYPYSTSLTTNPLTYASLNRMNEMHEVGTVWATMLYEILWNLIDHHGKNNSPKPVFRNAVTTDGRFLAMKLIMDGMALQPCNPTFFQARVAILGADTVLTQGANQCAIWKGFAKRGLGQGAEYKGSLWLDSNAVPSGVC